MADLVIFVGAAALAVLVCALGLAGWLANRRAGRAEAKVADLRTELAAERKANAELRGKLHDHELANAAWYRLLRPGSLDTTRPLGGDPL